MAAGAVVATAIHSRRVGISVSDALVAALRTSGSFPPPLGILECVLVAQTAPAVQAFVPPRVLNTVRHNSGFLSIDGTWSTASSPARPLGSGTYRVEIRGEFYRPLAFSLTWPVDPNQTRINVAPSGTAELMPSPSYPMPDVTTGRFQLGPTIVRGCLVTANGTPQPQIAVEAINLPLLNPPPPELPPQASWPFLKTETSTTGDWAIILPGRRYFDATPEILPIGSQPLQKNVTLRFSLPAGPIDVTIPVTLAADHSLRNTALRGRVVGRGGQAVRDAVITTTVDARKSISRAEGDWSLYFDVTQLTTPGVTVTATLPDGRAASAAGIEVRRQATIVVPTFEFP